MKKIEDFKEYLKKISYLGNIRGLVSWDLETKAPENAIESRSKSMAAISELIFNMTVSKEMEEFINYFSSEEIFNTLSEEDKKLVKLEKKEFEKSKKLPVDYIMRMAEATSRAQPAWAEARKKSDFAIFQPHLEKLLGLAKEYTEYIGYNENKYDVFLDEFEPGMKTEDVKKTIETLKNELVPFIQKILDSQNKPNKSLLHGNFEKSKQEELSYKVLKAMNYDFNSGRLDEAAHPFTLRVSPGDVRITTRYREDDFTDSLYSTVHEAGHALYELGLPEKFNELALCSAASYAVHESQSRFWENLVGRNFSFLKFLYSDIKDLFPKYKDISLEEFYKAINFVDRTPIRVDADEVTYNLHIMLRFEIEEALINDRIKVEDLPKVWNEKMKEYVGYEPKNDAEGVLQDVHWSHGSFGYFPSYMIGNLISAQLYYKMLEDIPNFEELLEKGETKPMLDWMRKNVHQEGKLLEPQDLVKKITGNNIDSSCFVKYVKEKYSKIYGI
jgi:carboxypeptidase Taq